MKSRNGFVSNSSSSSFLIAYKDSNKCEHCGRKDPCIVDMVREHSTEWSDTTINAEGIENILDYKKCNYGYDEKELQDIVDRAKKIEAKGKEWGFADVDISYHDETLNDLMQQCIETGTVVLIHRDD